MKIIVEIKYIIGGLEFILKINSNGIKIPIAMEFIINKIINIENNIKPTSHNNLF